MCLSVFVFISISVSQINRSYLDSSVLFNSVKSKDQRFENAERKEFKCLADYVLCLSFGLLISPVCGCVLGAGIDMMMVAMAVSAASPCCVLLLRGSSSSSQAVSPGKSPRSPQTSQVEG